ncbi:hypothetical protein GCM10009007_10020 [Formosimonas limnophila]|uniref:ABM domain-containing protein n=1 Tax=Formosimonas limnophila TaxID=1384487 RepID=A0A8J3CMB4_9BURK|nr:antibiotic biosynthesis monooxygenase family protein [Formosimonas limnophila]GHA71141.1 hypothetical protein GCM10009007_10020 [Formosimonas limnophila]
MSQSLKVIAQLQIQAEHVSAALPMLQTLVQQVRQELGCVSYELLQNTQDSGQFTIVEEWANESALAQHTDGLKASTVFQ